MIVEKNKVVGINYVLKDEKGTILDTTEGKQPFYYLHGANNIIEGLEEAMEGKKEGEHFEIDIPPEKAYGEIDKNLKITLKKKDFGNYSNIEPGMQFQAQIEDQLVLFTVVDVKGDDVVIDGNHPLAGKTLHFEVDIVEVRDATPEEVKHGHAHN